MRISSVSLALALVLSACASDDAARLAQDANAETASRSVAAAGDHGDADAEPVEGGTPNDCCTADASREGVAFMDAILDDDENNANHLGCSTTGSEMTCCVDPGTAINHPDPIPSGSSCFVGP